MNVLIGDGALILILEPGNLELLKRGCPVVQHVEGFFPNGIPKKLELLIHYSETPIADSMKFRELAKMTLDERSAVAQTVRPHCPECKSTVEQLGVWRNESPMALTFCPQCGCIFGMVPSEVVKELPKNEVKIKNEKMEEARQNWQRKYFGAGISHEMWPRAVEDAFAAGWEART